MVAHALSEAQCEVLRFPTRLERSHISEFVDVFVNRRFPRHDPRWLAENAMFLSVLRQSHPDVSTDELRPYQAFCSSLVKKLVSFPQYYRSYLALALEFQDLGLDSKVGVQAGDWILQQNLIAGELSDFRRCEVKYLLARAGVIEPDWNSPLDLRIDAFVRRFDLFRLPNKNAAMELIHLVFFRTAYGEMCPHWSDKKLPNFLLNSLRAVGILACLDQDVGLLAGACLALKMLDGDVPAAWIRRITLLMRQAKHRAEKAVGRDDYENFLMGCWSLGGFDFGTGCGPAGTSIFFPKSNCDPLNEILHVCRNEPEFERVVSHRFYSPQTRKLISEFEVMEDEFELVLKRIHTLTAFCGGH